jgi:serine/threonine-protein kinase
MGDSQQDLVGQTLGSFTLEKLIGQGGMGSVYLARQLRPQRNVAVKVLLPNRSMGSQGSQDFLARFRREADVIAKLEHVNIMPIYEYGEKDSLAYLVMPFLSGGSLREVLSKRGPLPLETVATYIDQAASALDYAHAHGVIHRDLKPANFLLHADGRLMLADFGIARIMDDETQGSTLTGAGTLLGTPEYMAPEMARGEKIDYRADIYELGVVLFQMLTGDVPFTGSTPYAIVYKHVQEPLPLVQYINASIPPAVDAVIQKATAKNSEERYSTVKAMAQDLRAAIFGQFVSYVGHQNQAAMVIAESPSSYVQPLPAQLSGYLAQPGYYPSYNTHAGQTPADNYAARSATLYPPAQVPYQLPYQSSYLPPVPPRKQHTWAIVLAVVCALSIVAAAFLAAMHVRGERVAGQLTVTDGSLSQQPATVSKPASTVAAANMPQPTAAPNQMTKGGNIVVGYQLYASPAPGCNNGAGQWFSYNGVQVNCPADTTQIISTARKKALQGIFLTRIHGRNYSSNYVAQVQLQPNQDSTGSFGLYFRNQPNNQLGAYTFLLQPDGQWFVNVYDNDTGIPTQLTQGALPSPVQGSMQMAVAARGSLFTFYINGQSVGSVDDQTYSNGSTGITVSAGADITVTNFILSRNAP